MPRAKPRWSVVVVVTGALAVLAAACDSDTCQDGLVAMKRSIRGVCGEGQFETSWFCLTCVDEGLYSVEGCECRPLTFDVDACSYDEAGDGWPAIRTAIVEVDAACGRRGDRDDSEPRR